MSQKKERRHIQSIKPIFQLKLVGVFVGMFALTFAIQLGLVALDLHAFAQTIPGGPELSAEIPGLLARAALFSLGMGMPLTIAVGLLVTHRIAGPVHAMERHLERVIDGEPIRHLHLRRLDAFQELSHLVNEAIDLIGEREEQGTDEGAPTSEPIEFRKAG